jgi:recombination protein RecT
MSNALAVKKETVDIVADKVRAFQNNGELFFPKNYVPENALKSAWLIIQETVDKDKKPVLDTCTKESIANSLLSMVVQGLNPDKKQCYFIAYGNKLTLQRSYFGSIAVAKSANEDVEDIYFDVVYKDDEFEYSKRRGKTVVTKHVQKLENVCKNKIIAAYACVAYKDGKEDTTIMTLDEIKAAWKMSKMYPVDANGNIKAGSTHDKFMADMCLKTAINKACKFVINSSDDRNLVVKFAKETAGEIAEARVGQEIAENANREVVDIVSEDVPETDPVPEQNKPEDPPIQPVQDDKTVAQGPIGPEF